MNSAGHEKIVQLVNSGLGHKFPEPELLRGAVDPDQGKIQSYKGIESKHHYHPNTGSHPTGRIHGKEDTGDSL